MGRDRITCPITSFEEIKLSSPTTYPKLKLKRKMIVLHMRSFKILVSQNFLPKRKSLAIIIKEGDMAKVEQNRKRFINTVAISNKKFVSMNIRIAMKS